MATFDQFYEALDPDPGVRGKQFEKFVKWFLKTDPEWQTQVEQVWLWDEYPERWGPDCGIDLVFKHKNGQTWAVQSKCISPDREISKAEIDSFLSESSDSRIHGRLLIASTDGIGRNARQVIERQEKQVVCFLLDQFQHSEIEFPENPNDLSRGKRKDPRKPRPHQEEAITAVVDGLKTADRGQLLMACGTGKTLTSLWIKERLKAERTLVLLPSLSLLSQTLREWTSAASDPFDWICVCSDKSVAKKDKVEDDWIASSSEIGVPVTNNPEEIKAFLKGRGFNIFQAFFKPGNPQVVFSTYQSSQLVAQAQQDSSVAEFDIVFADEAHRCAGKVSASFGCVLDSDQIQSKKKVFLTATPRVLSTQLKKSASAKDIEVASMDDKLIFGEVLYKLQFSEAIKRGLLSDYQVVVVGVDDQLVQEQIRNRDLLEVSSNGLRADAETLASHIALAKATNNYDLQRVITFHGRVKSAKTFAEDHLKVIDWMREVDKPLKDTYAAHVSGDMNSAERNKRINRLKNLNQEEIGILSNARCLSEGVDVPTLNGIAFIDPKSSQVDIIQAVGRAIRKSEDKSKGTIIIPIYLGDSQKLEEEIIESRFSNIWKIILALKSQDDALTDVIDRLRISLGRNYERYNAKNQLNKIVFDLPKIVEVKFSKSIHINLIRNTSDGWNESYGKLKRFAEENGHARPNIKSEPYLHNWVVKQRFSWKNKQLSQQKITLLESINGWVWNTDEADWEENYLKLKAFVIKHSHARPYTIDPELGAWQHRQRGNYKRGKLPHEKIKLLECLNGWVWDIGESDWHERFEKLQDFIQKNGRLNPTIDINKDLNSWTSSQRTQYNNGKLSVERKELLESLEGWVWDPIQTYWDEKYEKLKVYVEDNGSARPDRHHELGRFVESQRSQFNKNKLSREKINLLESLDGWTWNLLETTWNELFLEFKLLVEKQGNINVSQERKELQQWVATQRVSYNRKKLSQERIALLNGIKGWAWDKLEADWTIKFGELKIFVRENGHSKPTKSENSVLNNWVSKQKLAYKNGTLKKEYFHLLDPIEGWEWDHLESVWQKRFEEIKSFSSLSGHARPNSNENPDLSTWVTRQRKLYKNKELSKERIDLLNEIKGWKWNANEAEWEDKFEELKIYISKNGHGKPKVKDSSLGRWVFHQRSKMRKQELSKERFNRLNKLEGWSWDGR